MQTDIFLADKTIDTLVKAKGPNYRPFDEIEEYRKMVNFLIDVYDVGSELELLELMEERNINFWSPFPNERSDHYAYFCFYLQLPVAHRTKHNTALLAESHRNKTHISDVLDRYRTDHHFSLYMTLVDKSLFWEIRAKLYDDSINADLMEVIRETSSAKIAGMRNRSLTVATLATDASIQLLTKVINRLGTMEQDEIRSQDIAPMLKASSTVAISAQQLADNALALTELLQTIDELEQLELEELRIIDAEGIT